mmetsp:Transcript_33867/g.78769  ORF Transcript_33867/g.78769 Transcript_33867/m.78769 type:complete len:287 (-) Transcript_33867:36-896(-)
MEVQVDSFISCLVDGAIEEHTAFELSLEAEEAESIEFFEEDFLDIEWNEERSAVEEPVQLQLKTSAERSSGTTPKPNALLKYMCQLLDGALNGQARIFEQAAAPLDYLAASKQPMPTRYAVYSPKDQILQSAGLPLESPKPPLAASGGGFGLRFKHPQRALLASQGQASTFPLMQVPHPPSMPQTKRPPRRHFAVLTKNGDAANAAQDQEVKAPMRQRPARSALALDLGLGTEKPIEEPEDHDLRSNDVSSQGFLPPITTYSSKTMAGLAESVAGWRLVGADWELK